MLTRLDLPDTPGVYTFVDARGRPLYIGRATSLRDRVRSYFSADLIDGRGPRVVDMVTKAKTVRWQETGSVLEAILLESRLIKRYQPHYNVDEKDDKSSQYVIITDESWPRVFLVRARDFDQYKKDDKLPYPVKRIFGPYPHGGLIKEALRILRKMFPFKDKKSFDARHDAFYRALGRSPQDDSVDARRRYRRSIDDLILFFEGKKDVVKRRLEREMKSHAVTLRFEEAGACKKTLYAIDHINDIALIKGDRRQRRDQPSEGFRMEAYDVAHLSGTDVVGAFVVSIDGESDASQYRKFKISYQKNDDLRGLSEILERRLNHPEWPYPDLIIVDGDERHLLRASDILKARRISIPIVAVTKDDRHKAVRIIGDARIIEKGRGDIIALNAEAHRFVIAYHRNKRRNRLRPW